MNADSAGHDGAAGPDPLVNRVDIIVGSQGKACGDRVTADGEQAQAGRRVVSVAAIRARTAMVRRLVVKAFLSKCWDTVLIGDGCRAPPW